MDDKGFIKFKRGYDMTIHNYPNAFNLLAIIAQRAKWRESFNNLKLQPGEALIGDYKRYGLTRQQYRTAINWLISTNQITTRRTNRGTIAKIATTSIFDINISITTNEKTNQSTNLATIKQPLTKKDKKYKVNNTQNSLSPLTDGDLYKISVELNIKLGDVTKKHREILELIESGEMKARYPKNTSTYYTLRKWLRMGLEKGTISPMTEIERIKNEFEEPTQKAKFDAAVKDQIERGQL